MKYIRFEENGMRIRFRINDLNTVELVDFSAMPGSTDLPEPKQDPRKEQRIYPVISLQVTGESSGWMHAFRHEAGGENNKLLYVSHEVTNEPQGKLFKLTMKTEKGLRADYYMQFYTGISVVRTYVTLINEGTEDVGIEYVTSFLYEGMLKNGKLPYCEKTSILVPRNGWDNEAQWHTYTANDVGLNRMVVDGYGVPGRGSNRFHYGSADSWSSCEFLPMGIVKDGETGECCYFEIDHSGAWEAEFGSSYEGHMYLALLGPNDENDWWKNLRPGQSFTTVPVAFGVALGDESTAIGELTKYRRTIRRSNRDDERCSVVFNDYMNCLRGDPTEEKVMRIIDLAAKLGCEYYCMDCGWYDKGVWWDRVGEWQESPERFPNGMKVVCDYARAKGMKMGVWLEIEVMGTACEPAKKLPDDWFIMNHGKRRIDNKRYLLDFRNPAVRQYCSDVVDRLIRDYGVEFFKMDYNVTTGWGSELNADSRGDAMLEHYRCLYDWYREIYKKYPGLVIENCGSGGQRMDYGMLCLHSLQSTSDQTDVINNSYIAANVASAVAPEQAGMWVYPYEDEREHVIYNMVNGLLLRPYLSGIVWTLSEENFKVFAEGIAVYKSIRGNINGMTPFFPLGFSDMHSEVLAYGLKKDGLAYLSVFGPKTAHAEIPLDAIGAEAVSAKVLYPSTGDCALTLADNTLTVDLPDIRCARLIELKLK